MDFNKNIGDVVYHKNFGKGTISKIEKNGDSLSIEVSFEAAGTFDIIMQGMGFDIYFAKSKKSCSMFYMSNKNGLALHCEIVKVNSLPVYLEVEFVIDDDKATDDVKKRISDTIKEFFQELGITSFEPRNWKQLIEA